MDPERLEIVFTNSSSATLPHSQQAFVPGTPYFFIANSDELMAACGFFCTEFFLVTDAIDFSNPNFEETYQKVSEFLRSHERKVGFSPEMAQSQGTVFLGKITSLEAEEQTAENIKQLEPT